MAQRLAESLSITSTGGTEECTLAGYSFSVAFVNGSTCSLRFPQIGGIVARRRECFPPSGRSPHIAMSSRLIAFTSTVAFAFLFLLAGCSKTFIPNTDVEDTEDNRRVVSFCETYRKAVERRDVGKLLAMTSSRYFEDGGNVDPSDDLDYEGLREYLLDAFGESKAIRYEIRYRRVLWAKESDRVFVDYTYSASFKIVGTDDKDEWRRTVAENRLELLVDGDNLKILSGL